MVVLILCLVALLGVLLEIAYKSPGSFVEMLSDSRAFAESSPVHETREAQKRPEKILFWTT
jgi:hypothetical protein